MKTSDTSTSPHAAAVSSTSSPTMLPILLALSLAHLLNDMMQSLIPAMYPIIKETHGLDFGQIGLITFTFQLSASMFQPLVGLYTDKRPQPFSLVAGMGFTFVGLLVLAYATQYWTLILGAGLVGTGSSIFHPEATRVARLASGGRLGFAQSVFQVGGRGGSAIGPVLAALVVVPYGQSSVAWFGLAALLAMAVLSYVGAWYAAALPRLNLAAKTKAREQSPVTTQKGVALAVMLLIFLMLSKSAFQASMTSYYTFFLIDRFQVPITTAQMMLFVYLAAGALGVLIGGPLGDRIGRRRIIWVSILGALPFTLALPYANLFWTGVLSVIAALIMASAFASILVFAMELLPGRIGLIGGLFYGMSFGLGAISAAFLGELADLTSIRTLFLVCTWLPALGILTWFLPDIRTQQES